MVREQSWLLGVCFLLPLYHLRQVQDHLFRLPIGKTSAGIDFQRARFCDKKIRLISFGQRTLARIFPGRRGSECNLYIGIGTNFHQGRCDRLHHNRRGQRDGRS